MPRSKNKNKDDRSNKPIYTINYIKNAAIQQIRNNIDQTILIYGEIRRYNILYYTNYFVIYIRYYNKIQL